MGWCGGLSRRPPIGARDGRALLLVALSRSCVDGQRWVKGCVGYSGILYRVDQAWETICIGVTSTLGLVWDGRQGRGGTQPIGIGGAPSVGFYCRRGW